VTTVEERAWPHPGKDTPAAAACCTP